TFIDQCLADVDLCMKHIQSSAEQQDWEEFRERAHALRGVTSNLGLVQVAATSGELMRMADWQLKAEWSVRVSSLAAALRSGRKALDARSAGVVRQDDGERSPS
ncbi:Hpt domain-containing protein, partial [Stenotrophomonas sp. NPDC077659]|uniref:Hpt domain-containing protein n=1 Tax=Stenotrophomonas sp. NPDC077659 TaxID=3390694 RepID=UPI003CFEC304